jgi:HEAT repeat protein
MMWPILASILIAAVASPELAENKIRAHQTIHNVNGAVKEAEEAYRDWPHHRHLHQALIRSYALQGSISKMFSSWKSYTHQYADSYGERDLIETMAWGVILQADDSAKPLTRAIALIAAALTDNIEGVRLIKKGMKDRNAFIRALSAKVAGNFHDRILKEQVVDLAFNEPIREVRIEALRSIGKMGIPKVRPYLEELISSNAVDEGTRLAAIEALVYMLDTLPREKMEELVRSPRKGERLLACQAAVVLGLKRDTDLIAILLDDPYSPVRCSAIEALGIFHASYQEKIRSLLRDPYPQVAIYAAWYLTLHGETGHLEPFFLRPEADWRYLAAGALASSGDVVAMKEALRHQDPYVRWNAAFGLVGQRVFCADTCAALREALSEKKRMMWQEKGFLRYLAPSQHVHRADFANYPQAADQLLRLEILQTLAYLNDPQSHQATVAFLQKCVRELRGPGMTLLLTEGEEEGIDLIRACLDEKDPQVKISAALLLALWGRDPAALQTLYEAYDKAPRAMKEVILEGLGRVGDRGSIPFLIDQMNSSSSNLRLIAAASLLMTLRS